MEAVVAVAAVAVMWLWRGGRRAGGLWCHRRGEASGGRRQGLAWMRGKALRERGKAPWKLRKAMWVRSVVRVRVTVKGSGSIITRSRDYGEEIGRRSGGDKAEIGRRSGCGLRARVRVSSGIRAGVGREGAEVERVRVRVRLLAGCVWAGHECAARRREC